MFSFWNLPPQALATERRGLFAVAFQTNVFCFFLGHSVKEIRVRALKNIIFKLDHDLLCISDVVHKKDLYVKLLEWFNFEICPQQKDVLQLLGKLSKVEFLII